MRRIYASPNKDSSSEKARRNNNTIEPYKGEKKNKKPRGNRQHERRRPEREKCLPRSLEKTRERQRGRNAQRQPSIAKKTSAHALYGKKA